MKTTQHTGFAPGAVQCADADQLPVGGLEVSVVFEYIIGGWVTFVQLTSVRVHETE